MIDSFNLFEGSPSYFLFSLTPLSDFLLVRYPFKQKKVDYVWSQSEQFCTVFPLVDDVTLKHLLNSNGYIYNVSVRSNACGQRG